MTTVLFIGDPHFQISNLPEVDLFITEITKLAYDKLPDLIIIAGDLLHTHERLHTTVLNKAHQFVDEMRNITKTYILVGNHDYTSNTQFLTDNHWMNSMKKWDNVVIVDKVTHENINGQSFVFTPYVYPGRFVEALQTFGDDSVWKSADCIFAHQEFEGCKMGAIISVDGDKWSLDNPLVVSGHIHSRQQPQENIYYSGTPLQHAFGESEKNVVAYFEFKEGGEYELDEIELKLPRKKIVYLDVEDVDSFKIPKSEDKLRVTVSGNYDQFKALKKTKKYKQMLEKGIKVVFKPERQTDDDVLSGVESKVSEMSTNDFSSVLQSIVMEQKNPYVLQAYDWVISGKRTTVQDVFFL